MRPNSKYPITLLSVWTLLALSCFIVLWNSDAFYNEIEQKGILSLNRRQVFSFLGICFFPWIGWLVISTILWVKKKYNISVKIIVMSSWTMLVIALQIWLIEGGMYESCGGGDPCIDYTLFDFLLLLIVCGFPWLVWSSIKILAKILRGKNNKLT